MSRQGSINLRYTSFHFYLLVYQKIEHLFFTPHIFKYEKSFYSKKVVFMFLVNFVNLFMSPGSEVRIKISRTAGLSSNFYLVIYLSSFSLKFVRNSRSAVGRKGGSETVGTGSNLSIYLKISVLSRFSESFLYSEVINFRR